MRPKRDVTRIETSGWKRIEQVDTRAHTRAQIRARARTHTHTDTSTHTHTYAHTHTHTHKRARACTRINAHTLTHIHMLAIVCNQSAGTHMCMRAVTLINECVNHMHESWHPYE